MAVGGSSLAGQPARKSNRRLLTLGCIGGAALLGCLVCVGLIIPISQVNGKFDDGMAALSAGDCATAVPLFDEVVGSTWSVDEDKSAAANGKKLCQRYTDLVAIEEGGDLAGALIGYDDLLQDTSSRPLVDTITNRAKALFNNEPARLTNTAVCQRLDTFLERSWIADTENKLPLYYQGCGDAFTETAAYGDAIKMYERFAVAYPTHPAFAEVEAALAKATVAEARQAGAGEISAPQSVGGDGSGAAVVVIQNDSAEEMSLVFSGPEARFETLAPCATCQSFTADPVSCPEEGPIGTYELAPGTYEVVVKSISDAGVGPFVGTWELAPGEEYYSCFFVVTE
jgi:hypothetical protein